MKKDKYKVVITVLFWVYIVVLFRITVFRSGIWDNIFLERNFLDGKVNFTLFREYLPMIRRKDWIRFVYLFFGNIIWFIPFGMYLRYCGKVKHILKAVLFGFLLSFTIEGLQYVFGTGVTELDDLVLNTFGCLAGYLQKSRNHVK